MIYYIVLLFSLVLICFLTYKIWRLTNDLSIIVGFSLLYYWTLAGAWFFVGDQLLGEIGKDYGLHYHYLLKKMFLVSLDKYYLYSIVLYSLFIILIQLTLLLLLKYKKYKIPSPSYVKNTIFEANHYSVIIISFLSAIISFIILKNDILYALNNNMSVYTITRGSTSKLFTIHQIFNHISVFSLIYGLVVYLSGNEGVYIYSKKSKLITLLYIILIFTVIVYISMLGNKHELMFSGIFGILFLIVNNHKDALKKIIIMLIIIIIPLFLNDASRRITPKIAHMFTKSSSYIKNAKSIEDNNRNNDINNIDAMETIKSSSLSFLFSNEMFCAHFSMYGVLKNNLKLTYGSSIKNFIASFIPKILKPSRPEDIYTYYASQLKMVSGQGYTINHATGWYLNFGIIGIILGGFIFGLSWFVSIYFNFFEYVKKRNYYRFISIMLPMLFVANIPFMIRTGPEGYKSLIFEAIVIPLLIVSSSIWKSLKNHKHLKN
ncbi:MAG: hypothetical protein A2X12_10410 [Bacteroidetes bacterium GWE2_29_8]|nr:MAG: hypothetical protein A2X12_10410 [Bacteroidetes bacterium GWE2_29_8]